MSTARNPSAGAPDAGGDASSPRSIWDDDDADDAAAFARAPGYDAARPAADRPGADARAWLEAEATAGRALAEAAAAFARADERLRAWPAALARGGVERLALRQAAALCWAEGTPISPERLSLDAAGRLGRADRPDGTLARAAWAARRLAARRWSAAGPAAAARAAARADAAAERTGDRAAGPGGLARQASAQGWAERVRALRGAHPLTQAAFAEVAWRRAGLSAPGAAVEPGVVAMKLAARAAARPGGLTFAPLARRAGAGGDPAERAAAFYDAAARGADEALETLERLQRWRETAEGAVADLSGRSPPRLLGALAARFALSAADAARLCGLSPSAAQRNLALLADRGLAREITGRGRFRLWTAAL